MGGSNSPGSPPTPPAFQPNAGFKEQIKYMPELAAAEFNAQQQFAPQEAQLLSQIYGIAAPQVADTNMQTLAKIDPQSIAVRNQYGSDVSRDLGLGTQLSPDLENQIQQQIRGAQTARGNISGNAPVSAEGAFKGQAALNLYQQRLGNADAFLRAPTPESHFGELLGAGAGPVAQDAASVIQPISSLYQPQIGMALGQDNYTSELNQWSSSYNPASGSGGANPWMGALGGAASGAATGATIGSVVPGVGTLIGGVVGALAGGGIGYAATQ